MQEMEQTARIAGKGGHREALTKGKGATEQRIERAPADCESQRQGQGLYGRLFRLKAR